MTSANIPAGYQIHTRSWENDGDFYKTVIKSGLTEEEVRFFRELVRPFVRDYKNKKAKNWGNDSVGADDLYGLLSYAYAQHPNLSSGLKKHVEELLDTDSELNNPEWDDGGESPIVEFISEWLTGQTEEYCDYENFIRAVDWFKVFYVPNEIEEVTEKFSK